MGHFTQFVEHISGILEKVIVEEDTVDQVIEIGGELGKDGVTEYVLRYFEFDYCKFIHELSASPYIR